MSTTLAQYKCKRCNLDLPPSLDRCPHCAEPGPYPNVRAAEEERAELDARYKVACAKADPETLARFEEAMEQSRSIINRSVFEVMRLATSDNQLYNTYYQQLDSEARVPSGNHWDSIRAVADERVFPNYREAIRFGALALDDFGLDYYGDCAITLNTPYISERASCFHENSAAWAARYMGEPSLPKGFRAVWDDRSRLAVSKLADRLVAGTPDDAFPALLLSPGSGSGDDDNFIEVHIWGPITRRTFSLVVVGKEVEQKHPAVVETLRTKLAEVGVALRARG